MDSPTDEDYMAFDNGIEAVSGQIIDSDDE